MNKILRFFVIIIILGVLAGGFYYLFMRPIHYTDQELLVTDFMNSLNSEECDDYFMEETQDICITFSDLLVDAEFTLDNVESNGDIVTITIIVNEIPTEFVFIIEEVEVTGLRGFLTEKYYFIDTIAD